MMEPELSTLSGKPGSRPRAYKQKFPILFFLLGLVCTSATAQINITLDQFKAIFLPGQTHITANTDETVQTVDIGNPGGPNVYDFSNVNLPDFVIGYNYAVSSIPKLLKRYPANSVTIGDGPTTIENNPVFLFGQDTIFVVGNATVFAPEHYKHRSPWEILGVFPLAYGQSFSQSITVTDTVYNSSGTVQSADTYVVHNVSTVDGYGTLRINGLELQCLRIKLDHTNMGDKEFIYMTREGVFIDIILPSSQADNGTVQIDNMTVIIASTLMDVPDEATSGPADFGLAQNYPNPFNPATTIAYTLPASGFVSLKVFNVDGREVATLVSSNQSGGKHEVVFTADDLPSGCYYTRLQFGNRVETKKILLVK